MSIRRDTRGGPRGARKLGAFIPLAHPGPPMGPPRRCRRGCGRGPNRRRTRQFKSWRPRQAVNWPSRGQREGGGGGLTTANKWPAPLHAGYIKMAAVLRTAPARVAFDVEGAFPNPKTSRQRKKKSRQREKNFRDPPPSGKRISASGNFLGGPVSGGPARATPGQKVPADPGNGRRGWGGGRPAARVGRAAREGDSAPPTHARYL